MERRKKEKLAWFLGRVVASRDPFNDPALTAFHLSIITEHSLRTQVEKTMWRDIGRIIGKAMVRI
jgi:hypothetical protein